jgi:hypothetical protein
LRRVARHEFESRLLRSTAFLTQERMSGTNSGINSIGNLGHSLAVLALIRLTILQHVLPVRA